MTEPADSAPRVVLITGCGSSAGIGFATARRLAGAGAHVWATVRDLTKGAALCDGLAVPEHLRVRLLDVRDARSIAAVVDEIARTDGRVDALVNNAGYGLLGGVEQVDVERARAQFDTNLFGTLRVIQAVLPMMRARRAGRIVNVSTVFSAQYGPPGLGLYIASKAALDTVCEALAVEVAPWSIRVTNLQPGPVATELVRETSNRFATASDPYSGLVDRVYEWVRSERAPALQTPAEIAVAIESVLRDPDPPFYRQTGTSARDFVARQWRDPSGAEVLAHFAPFLPFPG